MAAKNPLVRLVSLLPASSKSEITKLYVQAGLNKECVIKLESMRINEKEATSSIGNLHPVTYNNASVQHVTVPVHFVVSPNVLVNGGVTYFARVTLRCNVYVASAHTHSTN